MKPVLSSIGLFLLLVSGSTLYAQTPTPIEGCLNGLLPRLVIGEQGRVLPGIPNNFRAEPTIQSEDIGDIAGGEVFTVLDGVECANNIVWWQVEYEGVIGWTGESDIDGYWVEPIIAPDPTQDATTELTPASTDDAIPEVTEEPLVYPCEDINVPTLLDVDDIARISPTIELLAIFDNPESMVVIDNVEAGQMLFRIRDGFACKRNGFMRQIEYDNGRMGWAYEYRSVYELTPIVVKNRRHCVGFAPSLRIIGDEAARVTEGAATNLRELPSSDAPLVGQIPGGESFEILIDGVACWERQAWYLVQYEDMIGWTAEGDGDTYWLDPDN